MMRRRSSVLYFALPSASIFPTLPTTLDPTVRLIRQQAARIGKEVVDGLAEGAYQILFSPEPCLLHIESLFGL